MVRDVAFGQYFPANSVIHKCDPRAKLIMLVGFLVIIFCTFNYVLFSSDVSSPSTYTLPLSGNSIALRCFATVDFPHPL